MARINNPELYPTKPVLNGSDRMIGSDSENEEKTMNFNVQSLSDFVKNDLPQVDWNETNTQSRSFIMNKPELGEQNVQSDWNETDVNSDAFILNKPTIPEALEIGLPYTYVMGAAPNDLTSGQFTMTGGIEGLPSTFVFSNTDNNGQDNSSLFNNLISNTDSLVVSVNNGDLNYLYLDLLSFPVDPAFPASGISIFFGNVLGTLSLGSLTDGVSYLFNYHVDTAGVSTGTDLGYTASTRTVTSSTGNNTVLPFATGGAAGLLPRYTRQVFTPTLYDAGGGATYTFNNNGSFYERIGNMVFFQVSLQSIFTSGTPTNAIRIGGMPFSVTSTTSMPFTVGEFSGGNVDFYSIVARSKGGSSSGSFNTKDIEFFIQTTLDGSIGDGFGVGQAMREVTLTNGRINVSGFYPITFGSADYVG